MYVQTDMSVCVSRSLCHDLVLQASDQFFLLTAKQRCLKERVRRMERERAKKRKINTEKSVCVCVWRRVGDSKGLGMGVVLKFAWHHVNKARLNPQ